MSADSTNRARQARHREGLKAKGLSEVKAWVPAERVKDARAILKAFQDGRNDWLPEEHRLDLEAAKRRAAEAEAAAASARADLITARAEASAVKAELVQVHQKLSEAEAARARAVKAAKSSQSQLDSLKAAGGLTGWLVKRFLGRSTPQG